MGLQHMEVCAINPTTRSDSPTQAGNAKDALIAETKAMAVALENTARQVADNLATLRDRHGMSQRDLAAAMNKSPGWVNGLLAWREAGFSEGGPFGGTARRKKERVQRAEHRKARTRKAETNEAKSSTSGNRLFEAAQGFYKSELAGIDDKTFDRVIGMLVEWRQASKAKASGQANDNKQAANSAVAGKIGKEPVKSREGFSEAAKGSIAAAVSGNDIDPEQSAADREAANSNLAIPDDGSIPPFLRREAA